MCFIVASGCTERADEPVSATAAGADEAAAGTGTVGPGSAPDLDLDLAANGETSEPDGKCAGRDPSVDKDGDGVTPEQGDCNDCDVVTQPGAYDYPANGVDEDCSGRADDEVSSCEDSLLASGDDPMDAARAMGLCRVQQGMSWGLVAARWVFPDGSTASTPDAKAGACTTIGAPPSAESRGLLERFGASVNPTQGSRLVALSTGVARSGVNDASLPGFGSSPEGASMCTTSVTPPGFPKDSPSCPGVVTATDKVALDAIALELQIKTPTNTQGLSFDFNFYTFEWPYFVCTGFNDFFVALLESDAPGVPADRNISFDATGNSVSVNNGFVDHCDPWIGATRPGSKLFPCSQGTGQLDGTGFDRRHAATGWLRTKSAVLPGETIRLRFAIWDMGDQSKDSTVLLDNLRWELSAGTAPTTERVPVPK